MIQRERYLQALTFGTPDVIPLTPGGGRKATRERWYAEGLPKDVTNITEFAYQQAGGTRSWPEGGMGFPVDERLIPMFEEKVLEERDDHLIVQDWKGNICEISNEFTTEHLRSAIDFVTRRWISCPVENRQDWRAMKERYDYTNRERYPADADTRALNLTKRTWWTTLHFSGPFWQMREWCGFEGLCMLMLDDPAFVEEMAEFWKEHVAGLIRTALEWFTPDEIHLSEDMAYKSFSMISPKMVRQFLLPCYKYWGEIIRSAGIPVFAMDSDGFIGELIPIWMEAGINACDPIEVAANNDIVEFRNTFGSAMAYRGGVDKRCIAKGNTCLDDEIKRLIPVIESGGFIPGCDHGVPHDVSWPNFVYYVQQLSKVTGWM
jgi:hypothetical protein